MTEFQITLPVDMLPDVDVYPAGLLDRLGVLGFDARGAEAVAAHLDVAAETRTDAVDKGAQILERLGLVVERRGLDI